MPPLGEQHARMQEFTAAFTVLRLLKQGVWRTLSIPLAPALLDEFLIEIHAIGQHHIPEMHVYLSRPWV
ncbi:MAG TPA: hypothetical protein VK901_09945 [Nitrospiraceae bacterium]|nr:hypothetical protein [Nitrospiraceae bacterium]